MTQRSKRSTRAGPSGLSNDARTGARRGARAGNTAVETALLAPVILFLLAGIVDYGGAVRERMALTSAVRSGLQYALDTGAGPAAVELAVQGALMEEAETTTVAATRFCECPDGDDADCRDRCEDSVPPYEIMQIDARRDYTPLMPWPGIDSPMTLEASARVRIQ